MATLSADIRQLVRNEISSVTSGVEKTLETKFGDIVTDINGKLSEVNRAIIAVQEAGKQVLEKIDSEKAAQVTEIQGFMGQAATEFKRHQSVIESVAQEVKNTQNTITQMTAGIRVELDQLAAEIIHLKGTGSSGVSGASGDLKAEMETLKLGLKLELDQLTVELRDLKAAGSSGVSGASGLPGGSKLAGFVNLKDITPQEVRPKGRPVA